MSRSRLQSLNSNIDHMKCSLSSKNSPRNTVDFEAACSVYIRFRGVNGYGTSKRSGFRRGCGSASWRPPSDLVDQVHVSGALSGACTGKGSQMANPRPTPKPGNLGPQTSLTRCTFPVLYPVLALERGPCQATLILTPSHLYRSPLPSCLRVIGYRRRCLALSWFSPPFLAGSVRGRRLSTSIGSIHSCASHAVGNSPP